MYSIIQTMKFNQVVFGITKNERVIKTFKTYQGAVEALEKLKQVK